MKYTRAWKIYGEDGHRQRESFGASRFHDFDDVTIISLAEDITHTNEYSVLIIIANSREECKRKMFAQLSDGIFENSKVGRVVEITNE